MVAVDLIKGFLINNCLDYGNKSISSAITKFSKTGLLQEVGDAAILLIDDYLTNGNEGSLFNEPEFHKTNDLNAFLKSDKLAKNEEFSSRLKTHIIIAKKMFRKSHSFSEMKKLLNTVTLYGS